MSRDPVRLEPILTREFATRKERMRGLSERPGELEWVDVALWGGLALVLAVWLVLNF